jgi:transcription elongation factor Elf1
MSSLENLIPQGDTMPCPRCKDKDAMNITPLKSCAQEMAIFNCSSCGLTFNAQGGMIVKNAEELSRLFASSKAERTTLSEMLFGETTNKATRALVLSKVVAYGYDMWLAGFKQGLVASCTEEEWKDGKSGSKQSGDARQPEK